MYLTITLPQQPEKKNFSFRSGIYEKNLNSSQMHISFLGNVSKIHVIRESKEKK